MRAEAIGIARIGQQLLGCCWIIFARCQRLVVAKDRRGDDLVHRHAEPFHGDVGQGFAVDGEIDGFAHPRIGKGVLVERRAILGSGVERLVAHVEFDIEDINRVDGLDMELAVTLQRRHISGGHARDQIELPGLELRHTSRIIGDFLAHMTGPGLLGTPEGLVAFEHQIALGLPGDKFVRPSASGSFARVEGLVGRLLGQASRCFGRDDEQADEIIGQDGCWTIGHDMHGVRIDDFGLLDPAHVNRCRIGARDGWNSLDGELHILGGKIRTIVEFHALPELEFPGRIVDNFPALGQARLDLQAVAGPGQGVEDMLEGFGMGAAGGEMRINGIGPAAHANRQCLCRGKCRREQGEGRKQERGAEPFQHGRLPQWRCMKAHDQSPQSSPGNHNEPGLYLAYKAEWRASSIPCGTQGNDYSDAVSGHGFNHAASEGLIHAHCRDELDAGRGAGATG